MEKFKQEEIKYYTPKIEEFHVGFEVMVPNEKGHYNTAIINAIALELIASRANYNEIKHNNLMLKYEEFRVKYLDQEDIESFGFRKSYAPSYITDEMVELYSTDGEKDWYNLKLEDNNIIITKCHIYNDITDNWDQECIFKGIIKNKSELKTILTQIGVLEDEM